MAYCNNQTYPLSNGGTDYLKWEKLPEPYRSALRDEALELDDIFPPDWPEIGTEIASAERAPDSTANIDNIVQSRVAPLSRANIPITSSSILDLPVIHLNPLSHPTGQKLAIHSF